MHDIKFIRENPEAFDAALAKRFIDPQSPEILKLDEAKRQLLTDQQELQSERNSISKQVGQAKAKGENADELMAQVKVINEKITAIDEQLNSFDALHEVLISIPNLLADDVPTGKDEEDNKELRSHGEIPSFDFTSKEHFELGEQLGMMDFERAARISGSRFVVLSSQLARLERALAAFMLDLHTTEFGYKEMLPPTLVKDEVLFGTGQLPKFAEDLYKTNGDHWLIPTAEVTLTNLVAGDILDVEQLPLRFTAYSPCFRSEAGAAGKDTRGMIRQHQFTKVELVSITHPSQSENEHERMTACAEEVLKRLELPYRVMVLCSGDTGFSAQKTYDLEVWLPGQDRYREISSCSNCGDFQARRMKARFRESSEKQTHFVHTLNGSGLAIGRTIIAILENYQQANGDIAIPTMLQPYMNNEKVISRSYA
jgi:seryl-tRNA synthetase